jgi:modification methylase
VQIATVHEGELQLFNTTHMLFFQDSRKMQQIEDQSIDLVITSPPYPMIAMWDEQFCGMNPAIKTSVAGGDYRGGFEAMHQVLDGVWIELWRVMKEGAFACINIGDATRTINNKFQLFANQARIQCKFQALGFDTLPLILWRKQTNAPNKFMGSGMLPAGAYVTLEHEYILIFRKGHKRQFTSAESKQRRTESGFFWEERNTWFSDLWDFKGVRQVLSNKELRNRSAAFPFVLPFRLINMYSLIGDQVLDPFMGTGTTRLAAIAAGRNSVGYEVDESFAPTLQALANSNLADLQKVNVERIKSHLSFVRACKAGNKELKYENSYFGFPVMTAQEKELRLVFVRQVEKVEEHSLRASYFDDLFIRSISPEELSPERFSPEGLQISFSE